MEPETPPPPPLVPLLYIPPLPEDVEDRVPPPPETPPPPQLHVFTPSIPLHHVHRIYQFPKTRNTDRMIETIVKENKLPSLFIDDPFIHSDITTLSFCKKDFIDEWVRTTQILLFDQFQEAMRNWTDITKGMKTEITNIKHERKLRRYRRYREHINKRAQDVDIEKIIKLPDDIVKKIWSYVDNEVCNKYFLGKYYFHSFITKNMLQRLNFQVLKTLYKKTVFCYHGLCMQKNIPSERYENPPMSRKTKQDFIQLIVQIIDDYLEMYSDPLVFTTFYKNGTLLSTKYGYDIETSDYYGRVYSLDFYEKRMLQLWKHLAVAFSLYLPKDYYDIVVRKHHLSFPHFLKSALPEIITPPLPEESPSKHKNDESPISFILL